MLKEIDIHIKMTQLIHWGFGMLVLKLLVAEMAFPLFG